MTPSSLPLCASIGPRTTSPTAQTLPAPVRHSSSTLMKPRSSSFTPVPSPSSPSVNGRRPTATTTLSTVDRLLALGVGVLERHAVLA